MEPTDQSSGSTWQVSPSRKKILFIINPISGTRGSISLENLLPLHLDKDLFDWQISFTKGRGDATYQAQKAVEEKYDIVVAVGGDGTINEVAKGIVETEVLMAVIPNGSGNGFANYFNISHDPILAIKKINALRSKKIDTGEFNEQLFLSVAGLGFDAQVAHAFDELGTRGFFSYARISWNMFMRFKPTTYKIQADDQKIKTKAFLVTVANASQFGNNAFIAPTSEIDDGLLDVVILKPLNFFSVLPVTIRLFTKTLHRSRHCQIIKAKKIKIKTQDTRSQIDGEPMIALSKNEVKINPQSLNMII